MNITEESYGQAVILICRGELTVDSLDAFKSAVEQVERRFDEGQSHNGRSATDSQSAARLSSPKSVAGDLVLNLEAVPFVDSAALEYLLNVQEKFNEKLGQVKLAGLDENVAKILEVTRLDNAFERFEDVSEAVKTI